GLLDQGRRVPGVEAAEDGAELAEGAEQGDDARVAEAEPGRPAAGLAGGHDQGLEDAGGRCWATDLALQVEQAAVDVASQLDEAGQVLQLLADAGVVGGGEGGLGW